MDGRFSRTERLFGASAMTKLAAATVMVVGLGGVGGQAFETLVRAGVGHIIAVDGDEVSLSNCNRQILADDTTIGERKTFAAVERAIKINPDVTISVVDRFLSREDGALLLEEYHPDLVLDCIDTVTAKVGLAVAAHTLGVPILACMATGNKLDPSRLRVGKLSKTHTCPLCRVMRKQLKDAGVLEQMVVWSDEPPVALSNTVLENGRHIPASAPFVPPYAGILMARWAVEQIINRT